MRFYIFISMMLLGSFCCGGTSGSNGKTDIEWQRIRPRPRQSGPLPVYTYEVVKTYPHDPKAFTEGLVLSRRLSCTKARARRGKSSLRKVDLETGKVVQKFDLPPESFGEGISMINGKIYQLTWQEGLCRVFDAKDFKLLREFELPGRRLGNDHGRHRTCI